LQKEIQVRRYLFNGFTVSFVILLVLAGFWLYAVPKTEGHIAINDLHTPFYDQLFKYLTLLGDGLIVVIVVIIILFFHFKNAVILLVSFLVSAGITQFFKKIVFHDALRPVKFFENKHTLYLVEGEHIHQFNSFPSGHATAAFCLFFCLAMMTNKRSIQVMCLVIAVLASFSRVYLSQHFVEDIFVGAFIGTIVSIFIFYILDRKIPSWYSCSIQSVFKK
jgi:membrane-associated phospholipid phosphatase